KATAFVRIDHQLKDQIGALHLLEKVRSALQRTGSPPVEFGWHPHLYSRNGNRYEVVRDERLMVEMIEEIHSSCPEDREMRCGRLGGNQGGNHIMQVLDKLGFGIDSSAFPGRKQIDEHRHFDWSRSGNRPYHPSLDDYQQEKSASRDLLEVPITAVPFAAPYD